MLTSILGARLSWHQADGWVFDPVIVGPDNIEYTLKEGPHVGRHAIQQTYYERVAPGIETTAWYEESGAVVHVTWNLETRTTRRFAALAAWLAEDIGSVYAGDNQDSASSTSRRSVPSARTGHGASSSMSATSWCSDRAGSTNGRGIPAAEDADYLYSTIRTRTSRWRGKVVVTTAERISGWVAAAAYRGFGHLTHGTTKWSDDGEVKGRRDPL